MGEASTPTKFYPGMVCDGVEIFKAGEDLKILIDGKVNPFSQAPYTIIRLLEEAIEIDQQARLLLEAWHPNSSSKRVQQFAWCRFGGLDFSADVVDGQLQDGEYHPCPNRGSCPAEGILCKMPVVNEQRLSVSMIKLMKLLTTTDTNELIAEKLGLAIGSFHLFKKKLYALLGVQTKQEVALIARDLGLV